METSTVAKLCSIQPKSGGVQSNLPAMDSLVNKQWQLHLKTCGHCSQFLLQGIYFTQQHRRVKRTSNSLKYCAKPRNQIWKMKRVENCLGATKLYIFQVIDIHEFTAHCWRHWSAPCGSRCQSRKKAIKWCLIANSKSPVLKEDDFDSLRSAEVVFLNIATKQGFPQFYTSCQ